MVLIKFSKKKNGETVYSNSSYYLRSSVPTILSLSPIALRRMIMFETAYTMEFVPFMFTDIKIGISFKDFIFLFLKTLKKEIVEKSIIFKIWQTR